MKTNTEKLFMHTSTHTHTYSLTHTLMLSALYSYLVCVLKAGSAVFSEDHHCLSLIMADAPGVSLINRQSLLINNWTAPLVLMLSQCHTCSVSHSSHSHICMVIPCLVSCYTHWEIGNVTIESQKVCTHFKKTPKQRDVVWSVRAVSARYAWIYPLRQFYLVFCWGTVTLPSFWLSCKQTLMKAILFSRSQQGNKKGHISLQYV